MRVLHVYKTYYPDTTGGIERVLWQLMGSLGELGCDNRLFVLSPKAEPVCLQINRAEVHRCQTSLELASNPMSWRAIGEFRQHVEWADVIHYQFPWPFGDLLHLVHGRSKPSVLSYQSDIVRQQYMMRLYRPLMHRFLSSVDRVCATSPGYLESSPVLRHLRVRPEIVPNGLDENSCPPASPATLERWRALLGEGFFLFIGVLRYYKGLHSLLEAAEGLDCRIVIAGTGPEEHSLREAARARGLDHVSFLGHVGDEDKSALLQLASALVFPSHLRSEAFGMSLVEAAMHSRPMISCEIGTGTSFVNLHGVTGLTVEPASPAALRQAMQTLASQPALAAAMGRAARERYEQMFTGQRMAQTYLRIYRDLLNQ